MSKYESKLKNAENDSLFSAILQLENIEECYRFFQDVLTIPELKSITQRWEVALLLSKGMTYTEIAKELGVSTATICRVNKALAYGEGGYKLILERLGKDGN